MVVHHWSDDGMVMYHRRSLDECKPQRKGENAEEYGGLQEREQSSVHGQVLRVGGEEGEDHVQGHAWQGGQPHP